MPRVPAIVEQRHPARPSETLAIGTQVARS